MIKKTPAERGMARHLRSCYPEYIKTKKKHVKQKRCKGNDNFPLTQLFSSFFHIKPTSLRSETSILQVLYGYRLAA